MKKVKIMLTAIAVLGIVGGALAFKAKKYAAVCYYSDTVAHTNADCPFRGVGTKTVSPGGITFNTTAARVAGLCPARSCPVRNLTVISDSVGQ